VVELEATKHWHKVVENGDEYFKNVGELLGKGGSSEVFMVKHDDPGRGQTLYARKLAPRGNIEKQEEVLRLFLQEWRILRRINHRHIVNLIASYTDKTSFALIMSPVAKESLKFILDGERSLGDDDLLVLRQSFGCLTAALVYLHDNHIRHKDIKPGNILVHNGSVYLCDFGISHDYSEHGQATTQGEQKIYTHGYAAPEFEERHPRNATSDVWSMGRVFCEIITVIKGRTVEDMIEYIGGHLGAAYDKPDRMDCWLRGLLSEFRDSPDDHPIGWALSMVRTSTTPFTKA
jgi:serine/threonine protein kinase